METNACMRTSALELLLNIGGTISTTSRANMMEFSNCAADFVQKLSSRKRKGKSILPKFIDLRKTRAKMLPVGQVQFQVWQQPQFFCLLFAHKHIDLSGGQVDRSLSFVVANSSWSRSLDVFKPTRRPSRAPNLASYITPETTFLIAKS